MNDPVLWHDAQYLKIRSNPLGPEGLHTATQGAHMAAHAKSANHFRQHQSVNLPKDYFIRDGFMVRRPRPVYEANFTDFTAKSIDLTKLIEFKDHVEQTLPDTRMAGSLREIQ